MGVSFSRRKNNIKDLPVTKSLETSLKIPINEEPSPIQAEPKEKDDKYRSALTPITKGSKRAKWNKKKDGKKSAYSKKMTLAADEQFYSKSLNSSTIEQRSLDDILEGELRQSLEEFKNKIANNPDFKNIEFVKDYGLLLDFVRNQELGRWRKFEDIDSVPNCLAVRLGDCFGQYIKVVIRAERSLLSFNKKLLDLMKLKGVSTEFVLAKIRNFTIKHNKKSGYYYLILTSEYFQNNLTSEIKRLRQSKKCFSAESIELLLRCLIEYAMYIKNNKLDFPPLKTDDIIMHFGSKASKLQFKVDTSKVILKDNQTEDSNHTSLLKNIRRITLSLLSPDSPLDPADASWEKLEAQLFQKIQKMKELKPHIKLALIRLINADEDQIKIESIMNLLSAPPKFKLENNILTYQSSPDFFRPVEGKKTMLYFIVPKSPYIYFYRPFSKTRQIICFALKSSKVYINKVLGIYEDEDQILHLTYEAKAKDSSLSETYYSTLNTDFLHINDEEFEKLENYFNQLNKEWNQTSGSGKKLLVQNLIRGEENYPLVSVSDLTSFVWGSDDKDLMAKKFSFLKYEEIKEENKIVLTPGSYEFLTNFVFSNCSPIKLDLEPLNKFEKTIVPICMHELGRDTYFLTSSEKNGRNLTLKLSHEHKEIKRIQETAAASKGSFFRKYRDSLFWLSPYGKRLQIQVLSNNTQNWKSLPFTKGLIIEESDFATPLKSTDNLFAIFRKARLDIFALDAEGTVTSKSYWATDRSEYKIFKSLLKGDSPVESTGIWLLRGCLQVLKLAESLILTEIWIDEGTKSFFINAKPIFNNNPLSFQIKQPVTYVPNYEVKYTTCTVFESKIVEGFRKETSDEKKETNFIIRKRMLDRRSEDFDDILISAQEIMTMVGKHLLKPVDFFISISPPSIVELNFVYNKLDSNLSSLMNLRASNHKGELLPIYNMLDFLKQIAQALHLLDEKNFYCYEINPMIIFVEIKKNMSNKLFYRLVHFEKASRFFGKNPFIEHRKELMMLPPVQDESDGFYCFDIHKSNIYSLAITALQYATQSDVTKLNNLQMHESLLILVDSLSYPSYLKEILKEMLDLDENMRPDALSLLLKINEIKQTFKYSIYYKENPEKMLGWGSNWSYNLIKNEIFLFDNEKNLVDKFRLPDEIASEKYIESICFDQQKHFYILISSLEESKFFELTIEGSSFVHKILPTPPFNFIYGLSLLHFNNRIYCIGGYTYSQQGVANQTKGFYFSLKRQVWCIVEQAPKVGRKSFVYEVDGNIYAIEDKRNADLQGNLNNSEDSYIFLDVYSVNHNQWKSIPIINKLNKGGQKHPYVVLPLSKYSLFIWEFGSRDIMLVSLALSRSTLLKIEVESSGEIISPVFNQPKLCRVQAISRKGDEFKFLLKSDESLYFIEFQFVISNFQISGKSTKII